MSENPTFKIRTPEGDKEATALDFSLEDYERPTKIVCSDGHTLVLRCTVTAVFTFTRNDGTPDYVVSNNVSIAKIS